MSSPPSPLDLRQKILVEVCCSPDPRHSLSEQLANHATELDPATLAWLQAIDVAELELLGELAQRGRFSRLLASDPQLREQFETDPPGFRQDFELYADTVEELAADPDAEAAAFRQYMDLLG